MSTGCRLLIEIICAFFFPPLGVCLRYGCCTVEVFICFLLTLLGFLPGLIYAFYAIVLVNPDRDHDRDRDRDERYYTAA